MKQPKKDVNRTADLSVQEADNVQGTRTAMTAISESLRVSLDSQDKDARFTAFVESHRERAVSTAWRLIGGDRATAEDIAQDAFIKAYRALPRFRGDAAMSTWFYRILVRQAHSHLRWRRVRQKWASLWNRVEAPQQPPLEPGSLRIQVRIASALGQLSNTQREVFILVHLEGFTVSQVSEILGKSPGTIKSHLHRGLKSLREQLSDLRDEP